MNQQIVFNGKTYNSIEEMPTEIRLTYETLMGVMADKNQNGMPDIFEGANTTIQTSQASIIFNGQVYHNVDELPAEARTRYEQAMGKPDANHNGLPDAFKGWMENQPAARAAPSLFASEPAFPSTPEISSSNIEPEETDRRRLFISAALIGLLCMGVIGAIIIWLVLAR